MSHNFTDKTAYVPKKNYHYWLQVARQEVPLPLHIHTADGDCKNNHWRDGVSVRYDSNGRCVMCTRRYSQCKDNGMGAEITTAHANRRTIEEMQELEELVKSLDFFSDIK